MTDMLISSGFAQNVSLRSSNRHDTQDTVPKLLRKGGDSPMKRTSSRRKLRRPPWDCRQ